VLESIPAEVTTLFGLAVPSPGVALAVGRSADGGVFLAGSGALDASFHEVPGLPASQVLSGVWSDPSGDVVVLAGRSAQGGALIEGSLADGGAFQAQVDGGTVALLDCWGDAQGNLYAVGVGGSGGLVLRESTGGTFAPETTPAGLTTVFRITGGATVYALAVDNAGGPQILARVAGIWTEIPGVPAGVHFADLALEPDGTLVVVGDDGFGDGLGYLYSADAGSLLPLSLPATLLVPTLRAVTVLPSGEMYLGASPGGSATPFILHASDGGWTQENLPYGVSTLNQLDNAGADALYAVGTAGSSGALLKRSP
jgi:hypothetical protein